MVPRPTGFPLVVTVAPAQRGQQPLPAGLNLPEIVGPQGGTRFMPRTMLGEVVQTVARGLDLCVAIRERPPAFSDPPSGSRRLRSDHLRTTSRATRRATPRATARVPRPGRAARCGTCGRPTTRGAASSRTPTADRASAGAPSHRAGRTSDRSRRPRGAGNRRRLASPRGVVAAPDADERDRLPNRLPVPATAYPNACQCPPFGCRHACRRLQPGQISRFFPATPRLAGFPGT